MDQTFNVTASPQKKVALNTNGSGEVTYTISNVTDTPSKVRAVLGPDKAPVLPWLKLIGDSERLIPGKKSDDFVVKVNVPPGTKPGDYSFRLDAVSVARPNEDATEGPTIGIPVTLSGPAPRPFPWWILIAAVVVIGVGIYAALKIIPSNDIAVPDLTNKNLADATQQLQADNLKIGNVDNLLTQDPSKVDVILKQSTAPGTKVPVRTMIDVSAGVAIVTVPDLRGPLPAAQAALAALHLDLNPLNNVNQAGAASGQVLGSNPAAGNSVQSHTKVTLTVQEGNVTVPDLTGQTLPVVQATLANNNLVLGAVSGLVTNIAMVGNPPIVPNVTFNVIESWSSRGQMVPVGTAINVNFPGPRLLVPPRVLSAYATSAIARKAALVPQK